MVRNDQESESASLMAMERAAKQMQPGLLLFAAVIDPAGQVRVTTQPQRSVNAPVVEIMEQLADTSGQGFPTAQQVAGAAGSHTDPTGGLETTATTAKDQH